MKLSLQNLDILLKKATGKDIDLAIHLAQFQDDDGLVCGIHYKNITSKLGISYSSFYKSLNRLESYGIINIDWRNDTKGHGWGWWSVKFVNNDYSSKSYNAKPYLNVNHEVLHRQEFYNLSLSEKKIVLRVMRIMNYRTKSKERGITLRLDTLMRWTGKSRRSVVRMISNLSVLSGMMTITLERNDVRIPTGPGFNLSGRRSRHEADTKAAHAIHYVLNRIKCKIESYQAIDGVRSVLRQYNIKGFRAIAAIVGQSIRECGYLSVKYVHSLIREVLGKYRKEDKAAHPVKTQISPNLSSAQ